MHALAPNRRLRAGFTLTELIVAVVVLLVVLLAASRIFSTTQQVASIGEANADVLQEIAAFETQLREDLANISRDGPLMIRSVVVPNDIRGAGLPLLDPNRPANAAIRSDQLVFFRTGFQTARNASVASREKVRPSSTVSRVYYGHGFQLADANRGSYLDNDYLVGWDVLDTNPPWSAATVDIRRQRYGLGPQVFTPVGAAETVPLPVLPNSRWLFVRQAMLLADDNGPIGPSSNAPVNNWQRSVYLDDTNVDYGGITTALTPLTVDAWPGLGFRPQALQGRLDAAAGSLSRVRRSLTLEDPSDPTSPVLPWLDTGGADDQYDRILDAFSGWPRAERRAATMNRLDQALTNGVLGSGVSEIRMEWTWGDGVGRATVGDTFYQGCGPFDPSEDFFRPWFGPAGLVQDFVDAEAFFLAPTIFPDNIETWTGYDGVNPGFYTAVFGYNTSRPVAPNPGNNGIIEPYTELAYTPWPTAIRITMTVHDPGTGSPRAARCSS